MQRRFAVVGSLVGTLYVLAEGDVLSQLRFDSAPPDAEYAAADALLHRATEYLRAYFAGERPSCELPLAPQGTTFQRAVWSELARIAYGETRSYRQIAQALGAERAVRAVGRANGANPLPILIPCHRVIGANGALVGYGGGLERKVRLLELEGLKPRQSKLPFGVAP